MKRNRYSFEDKLEKGRFGAGVDFASGEALSPSGFTGVDEAEFTSGSEVMNFERGVIVGRDVVELGGTNLELSLGAEGDVVALAADSGVETFELTK